MTYLSGLDRKTSLMLGTICLLAILAGFLVSIQGALLVFGALVTITVLITSLAKPTWVLTIAYPLLIIIGQVPIPVRETTISLERMLLIAGGLGVLGGILVTRRLSFPPLDRSVVLGVVIWLGFYCLSLVAFPSEEGLILVLGFIQKGLLAILVYISIRNTGDLYTILKFFLISSFIASLFTIFVYIQEGSLEFIRVSRYLSGDLIEESFLRGLARAGTGNTMALWIAIFFLGQSQNRKSRFLWALVVIWFGFISLFALRRETLVTIFLGLSFIIWYLPREQRVQTVLVGLVILAVVSIFVAVSPEWSERLTGETINQFITGTDPRTMLLLRFTPAAILASPLLGHGPGNYASTQLRFPGTVTTDIIQRGGISPHNAWSAASVEAGLGAFIGLCIFVIAIGRPLFESRSIPQEDLANLWTYAPLLFFQLLISLFFGQALLLPVIWFWIGFLMALEQLTSRPPKIQNTGT